MEALTERRRQDTGYLASEEILAPLRAENDPVVVFDSDALRIPEARHRRIVAAGRWSQIPRPANGPVLPE